MRKSIYRLSLLLLMILSLSVTMSAQVSLKFTQLDATFNKPLGLVSAGDGSENIFVLCKDGMVERYDLVRKEKYPWLDLSSVVEVTGEAGILGGAFHPVVDSAYFYIMYTVIGLTKQSPVSIKLSRFSIDKNKEVILESETLIMSIDKPHHSQSGGGLAFGPKGYLHIGTGDGGGRDDQFDNGQNPLSYLGKILRIDIDRTNGIKNYAIPEDNPFVSTSDTLSEIWSLGLRNPFRFSFDPETGDFWISDKANSFWQEVNYQKAGNTGGQNYGWNCQEGFDRFSAASSRFCGDDSQAYDGPLIAYGKNSHKTVRGGSVTGGKVYRGPDEQLRGYYIFGDFYSKRIFMLDIKCGNLINPIDSIKVSIEEPISNLTTFGTDNEGALYAVDYNGYIFKVQSAEPATGVKNAAPLALNVYPNPTREGVTLDWPGGLLKGASVMLYSADGKAVHRWENLPTGIDQNRLALPALPRGLYTLYVNDGKQGGRARISIM